jgi:uncharacterized protein
MFNGKRFYPWVSLARCMKLAEFKEKAQLGFYIRDGEYFVHNEEDADRLSPMIFALIRDGGEITVIEKLPEGISQADAMKLITFTPDLPSDLVGFLLQVAKALAKEGVPIFVMSSMSTDHLLVQTKYIEKVRKALKGAGLEESYS